MIRDQAKTGPRNVSFLPHVSFIPQISLLPQICPLVPAPRALLGEQEPGSVREIACQGSQALGPTTTTKGRRAPLRLAGMKKPCTTPSTFPAAWCSRLGIKKPLSPLLMSCYGRFCATMTPSGCGRWQVHGASVCRFYMQRFLGQPGVGIPLLLPRSAAPRGAGDCLLRPQ
jgi:hypothetical protein